MRKFRFVSGVKNSRRIVDTSPKAKTLDSAEIERAFNAVPVVLDSDYPSEAVMDAIRRLRVPPLTKVTESLFPETPADK